MRILNATYRCMAHKGSGNVSTRDIAREAGITLSLIHYHFPSKEELLVTAAAHTIQRQLEELLLQLEPNQAVADRLDHVISFVRNRFESQDPTWRKVYFDLLSMAAWSPKIAEEVKKLQDRLVAMIVAGTPIESAPTTVNITAGARVLLAALNGLALQALHGTPRAELDQAYEFLEQAILSEVRTNSIEEA